MSSMVEGKRRRDGAREHDRGPEERKIATKGYQGERGDYFKSWRQHFIVVWGARARSRSRRSVNYVGRNHFLPVGQLPNLKGIALHGSPVTELIFFQSNCVSSWSPDLHRRPPNHYFHTAKHTDACHPTIASIIAPFAELPGLIMGVTRRLSKSRLGAVAFLHRHGSFDNFYAPRMDSLESARLFWFHCWGF